MQKQEPYSWPVIICLGLLAVFAFPVFLFLCACWLLKFFIQENTPQRKAEKEWQRQEESRVRQENKERQQFLAEQRKKEELAAYLWIRREIEKMPPYEIWRQGVFEKYGRKCMICGATENLEIDHRYYSLYQIVKAFRIANTTQAYECKLLWDVNNGAPLCKRHHDTTKTSMYRVSQLEKK